MVRVGGRGDRRREVPNFEEEETTVCPWWRIVWNGFPIGPRYAKISEQCSHGIINLDLLGCGGVIWWRDPKLTLRVANRWQMTGGAYVAWTAIGELLLEGRRGYSLVAGVPWVIAATLTTLMGACALISARTTDRGVPEATYISVRRAFLRELIEFVPHGLRDLRVRGCVGTWL